MNATMAQNPYTVKLKNRGKVTVSGPDATAFLQDIITNDIMLMDTQPSLYACLLTPQGKFLHDFFLIRTENNIILDCEGGSRATDLEKRLNIYKLRKDVTITCEENVAVYAIFGETQGYPDPRHPEMGYRSCQSHDLPEKSFETWDSLRISFCIPDGSRDLIPEKSTLDEGRIDQLHGVSYDKGCFVGQEITARMHYRGLGKKHLEIVDTNNLPDKAQLRSSCGDKGLALVRA